MARAPPLSPLALKPSKIPEKNDASFLSTKGCHAQILPSRAVRVLNRHERRVPLVGVTAEAQTLGELGSVTGMDWRAWGLEVPLIPEALLLSCSIIMPP